MQRWVALSLAVAMPLTACSIAGGDEPSPTDSSFDASFEGDSANAPESSITPDSIGDSAASEVDAIVAPSDAPDAAPPSHAGVTLRPGGASFRVWAAHATQVFVAGDFNAWSESANALTSTGDGYFQGDVAGAKAGDAYKYSITNGTTKGQRADPRAMRMTGSNGSSVIVDHAAYGWKDGSFTPPPFESQVIYEMHVGTFNVTGTPGLAPGTWTSAIARLDHLKTLGINMIEVLPPAEFAGDFGWGYNPAFPFAPEKAYGTPEELKRFVDEAHARGIGVIVDVVHNHYGRGDLTNGMWCIDLDCLGAANGGVYFYIDSKRETGFGPRPDYSRVEVRDFIVDNTMMWLFDYHADGLRWDSVVNIRRAGAVDLPEGFALLQRMNDAVDATKPSAIMIAEDLQNDDAINLATKDKGAGFDAQWDPGFNYPMKGVIVAATDAARSMNAVRDALTHAFAGSGFHRVIFTEDHDQVSTHNGASNARLPQLISPSDAGSFSARKQSTLGAAVLLTAPGIPMLFQGQEFLENLEFAFNAKLPLDWSKTATYAGILQMYEDLIRLRKNVDGATAGLTGKHVDVFHLNDTDKLIAYRRWKSGGAGDDVVVLCNWSGRTFTSYEIGFPTAGTWHVRFNGDLKKYSADFAGTPTADVTTTPTPRDGQPHKGALSIGPYTMVVLSQ